MKIESQERHKKLVAHKEQYEAQATRLKRLLFACCGSALLFLALFVSPLADFIKALPILEGEKGALRFLLPLLQIVVGAPVLIVLWYWRDQNQRDTLENHRADTLLREFQEIQKQAAGLEIKDGSRQAGETLQIAALHQLRPFLRGDKGESFKEPSFEIFRALLDVFAERRAEGSLEPVERVGGFKGAERALHRIIKKEHKAFFNPAFDFSDMKLAYTELFECSLRDIKAEGIDFRGAQLGNADFTGALLWKANFTDAKLGLAWFTGAQLEFAKFTRAKLVSTDFTDVKGLVGADFTDAEFVGADFTNAKGLGKAAFTDKQRAYLRKEGWLK